MSHVGTVKMFLSQAFALQFWAASEHKYVNVYGQEKVKTVLYTMQKLLFFQTELF